MDWILKLDLSRGEEQGRMFFQVIFVAYYMFGTLFGGSSEIEVVWCLESLFQPYFSIEFLNQFLTKMSPSSLILKNKFRSMFNENDS